MKITYPVPERTIVGYRQVPVFKTELKPTTLLDYDFKAAKRAKGVAGLLGIVSIYAIFPAVLTVATAIDFVFDVGKGIVAAATGGAEQYAVAFRQFYKGSPASIRSVFKAIID